ncbi:Na+/H+ antiporter NhaC [Carnobacterium divergens]|uniref:Na+/H+ antiporter NhaC n=1 Tax=Carnobacterium divergens TaxID=2748 RepID=UPI0039AEC826
MKTKQSFKQALGILVLILLIIGVSVIKFGVAPQTPLIISIGLLILWGRIKKHSWDDIHKGIQEGISTGLVPMIIFILIGALIGVWIAAGIIPSMMVFGFKILNPSIFVPSVFIICAIVGTSIGSAFTTVSTVGISLLGMGTTMGFNPALVAGAIVSGAVFGDKMSPLSDSTNLSAAVSGVDLFRHIKNLMWTTIPALLIALVLFFILGNGQQHADTADITKLVQTLKANFSVSFFALIPILVMFFCSWRKIPAIPTLLLSIIVAVVMFFIEKPMTKFSELSSILQDGFVSQTGDASIDALLTRGGVQSMMWSISLIILALALGGLLVEFKIIDSVMKPLSTSLNSTGKLILATALSCIGVNLLVGEQYLSIILPGKAFKKSFDDAGLHPLAMSRVLEDAGAVVNSLVPWSVSGVFIAGALSIPTVDYLPFAFFCLLCPVITVFCGFTGIGIQKQKVKKASIEETVVNQ